MRRVAPSRTSPWPFWLLLAAWVFANSPQAATYALLGWLSEARHFAHQQELSRNVAFLLGGEDRPVEIAGVPETNPERPPTALPVDAVLKKLPLSLVLVAEVLPPQLRPTHPFPTSLRCPAALRAAPPHGPPRVNAA